VADRWTELGHRNPMWAALTLPGKSGASGWDEAEFLATGRAEIDAVLARLDELGVAPSRGTALDFGCGPGRLTAALASAGFERAIGVDISPSMLDTARRITADQADRCEFRLNEGSTLAGIPDSSVDLVYTCRVLQHMPPELALGYLREFLRVSRGLVVFQLPAEPAPGPVGGLLRRLPAPVLNRLRRGMQMHGTPPTEVTGLIGAAGGRTVAIEPDTSAGPRWRSYLYIAEAGPRPGAGAGPRRGDGGDAGTGPVPGEAAGTGSPGTPNPARRVPAGAPPA
jgi:SAM-dependent methyltransferase